MKAGKVGRWTYQERIPHNPRRVPPVRLNTAPLRQVEYPAQAHRAAVRAKVHILRRDGPQLAPEGHADV
jgi:hypothetical protein